MNTTPAFSIQKRLRVCGWIAVCTLAAASLGAQSVTPRIQSEITLSEVSPLKGSVHPLAQSRFDAGRLPANTRLNSISIVFNRSAAQEADLQALIAAQQNPASPLYHQWLNPDQFGARFGMAQADLDKVQTWLQQQGFSIDSVARSRNMIRFSGTARQVENAFATQMHYYKMNGVQHFAPSTELSVPAALAPAIAAVRNLNDFRPRPMHVRANSKRVRPSYTFYYSNTQQAVLFAPGDIKVAYDINPLAGSGFTGTGQSIAIMGQSAIQLTDIEAFQSAAGLATKDPTTVLVPDTGTSTVQQGGDEGESDLDLEWSSATAPGADIIFVYTGSDTTAGVFDSLFYTIEEDLAPIVSISYGSCEPASTKSDIDSVELVLAQGAAQGQTIVASAGDQGSTACSGESSLTTAQQEVLAVNYPASSAFITAVGGTEITAADDVVGPYWSAAPSTTQDQITSALQYIPEVAWNDDPTSGQFTVAQGGGLSASGGGASIYVARPSWQTGTIGGTKIPSGSFRLVPDVSLYSSPNLPGYLYCTSDQSDWSPASGTTQAQQSSCTSGFYDNATGDLIVAGGTSFAAPIFAGMVAIVNQAKGYTTGQGLINPTLYSMAADSTTYNSAFHDIKTSNNYCTAGSTYCASNGSTLGFAAGPGYDEVTGLGSVDLNNLVTAWAAPVAPLAGTTTSITSTSSSPLVNTPVTFTITVVATSGTPSGSVNLSIDGGGTPYSNGGTTATATLSSTTAGTATATYQATFSTAGTHQIVAEFPSSATLAASTGVVQVTVGTASSGKGTIALTSSPATLTITQGTSGVETITVTPAGGYTGTVLLTMSATSSNLTNLCYNFPNITTSGQGPVTVSGTTAAPTQLTLDTLPADCGLVSPRKGGSPLHRLSGAVPAGKKGTNPAPLAVAFSGLLLVGFLGRYSRKLSALAAMAVLAAVSFTATACGGGGGGSNPVTPDPPKGTYTITVTGQDSVTSTITGTTSFSFVIQ
jgi:subtilase family serine protease